MVSFKRRVLFAAIGGFVTALGLPPFELLGGYFVLPGIALSVWTWRDASPRQAVLLGWVGGLCFFGLGLEWIRYFGVIAFLPLMLLLGSTWAGTALVSQLISSPRWARPALIASIWVTFEAIIARAPFGGLPWAPVGLSMHDQWLRDLSSTTGIAGVSFLLVFAAAGLTLYIPDRWNVRNTLPLGSHLVVAALIGILGVILRPTPIQAGTLRIAALQANVWNRDPTPEELASRRWLSNAHLELAEALEGEIDLIIFPESSLDGNDPELDTPLRSELVAVGARHNAHVLANAIEYEDGYATSETSRRYNTDYLYDPSGSLVGKYSKIHLVPFGEYLPLRGLLDFIPETKRVGRFVPGTGVQQWRIAETNVVNIICFESVFGGFTRDAVNATDGEVVVVSTNNRSYEKSGASEQHVAHSQMRAIELNRPVVHAANSGISAVINADGDVTHRLELFERGAIVTTVQGTRGDTLYGKLGEWLPLTAAAVTVLATGLAARKRLLLRAAAIKKGHDHEEPN